MTIDELGGNQRGVVALHQALDIFTPGELETEIAEGRLLPHRRGVYRCWGAPACWEQDEMAAILAIGLGAAWANRHAAAKIHGVPDVPFGGRLQVVTVRGKRPELVGVKVVTTNHLPSSHVTIKNGIPVTTVARTIVDLSACLSHQTWKKALRGAVRRGLTSYAEVQAVREDIRARGRRRTTVIDEVLASLVGDPGDSEGEAMLVQWLAEAGFPLPEQNVWVLLPSGERFCLDVAYMPAKLDMEYDSIEHHAKTPEDMLSDRDRDDALILAGYAVVRATKRTSRRTFLRRVYKELEVRAPGLLPRTPP